MTLQRIRALAAFTATLCLATLPPPSEAAAPVAQIDAGILEGIQESATRSFLGVPFAAPPVGELRWRAPAPLAPWSGTRAAKAVGPMCLQAPIPPDTTARGQEDCLYLNVHVPTGVGTAPLPVIVWLHGGAFSAGAGSDFSGQDLAAKAGAMVVTVNYRLGMLGFLGLPSLRAEDARGNHGLQDQLAALRWVQRNIAAFGGDPGKVTLQGESAGGISICSHLVSPKGKGLFHRAVLESSACAAGFTPRELADESGEAFAARLGCPAGPGQVACLRGQPASAILAATPGVDPTKIETATAVGPFVDGAVVASDPVRSLMKGQFHRVPVIIGTNRDEGRIFPGLAFDVGRGAPLSEVAYKALLKQFTGSDLAAAAAQALYPSKRHGSPNLAIGALVTDSTFTCPTLSLARKLATYTPTYVYEFQDRTVPPPVPDPFMSWGAYHGAEVGMFFHTAEQFASLLSPDSRALADRMMAYWAAFARTGKPTDAATAGAAWPAFKGLTWPVQRFKLGGIDTDTRHEVYSEHQCLLWDLALAFGPSLLDRARGAP